METGFGLHALDLFASYFIRTLVAYVFCLALSWICFRPHVRFLVWTSFLVAAGLYWIFLLVPTGGGQPMGIISMKGAAPAVPWSFIGVWNWSIPLSWTKGLGAAAEALVWCYGAGAIILLLLMLRNRIKLQVVLRRATAVSGELDHTFAELCDRLHVRPCRLFVLPGLTSPATAYSWRPRILLPESLHSYLDEAQLADVLCHELVHVKRRDYLWGTISELTRCLLFFHPAIWLALRNARRQRELACDAAVVRQRENRRPEYAECLTRLARVRLAEERAFVAINFARSGSFLALRVRTLLTDRSSYPWWRRGAAFTASLVLPACFGVLWPALAVVLQFAPPVAGESIQPIARVLSTKRNTLRQHLRVRPSGRAPIVAHVPTPTRSEDIPSPPYLALSVAAIPNISDIANILNSPKPDIVNSHGTSSPELADSSPKQTRAGASSRDIPETPVWSESPPQRRSAASPSWRKALVRIAAATVGGMAGRGSVEGPGSDQSQEGNHFVTLPGEP